MESQYYKNGTKMNLQNSNKNTVAEEIEVNTYNARELLGSKVFAKIMLDQQTYLLKLTKQNKLILTK